MKRIRRIIRSILNETNFPLEGGSKMRIHHSRAKTRVRDKPNPKHSPRQKHYFRAGSKPKTSGYSQKIGNKPEGLWYECQDGSSTSWKEFCAYELTGGANRYDSSYNVILNDSEILFIPDEHHFEKFYKMYSTNPPYDPDGSKGFDKMIDWPKVSKHYAGIEICPYLSSKRMADDGDWYYPWDVASGCVWATSGIKELVKAGSCK